MKLLDGRTGLILRLGAMIVALLAGQQAMAVGTRAGTEIQNTATVNYEVSGLGQAPIDSNQVRFFVDRRVNFTLTPVSTPGAEIVVPGQNDAFVDFTLTNLSNSDLDFFLALDQVASGLDVDGEGNDSADMDNIEWAVVTAADPTPTQGGAQYVDELAADASVRIRAWGDAAATLLNAQIAGLELTATAREAGGTGVLGAVLDYNQPNGDLTVENVDVIDADGVRDSIDGFVVQSAALSVVKDYTVLDDGFGGDIPLPGALVEYTITITNGSAVTSADAVVITDTLDTELEFVSNWSGVNDMTLAFNGGAAAGCTEEAGDDQCERSGQDLTFDGITIDPSGSLEVTYRVTILDTDPTPP